MVKFYLDLTLTGTAQASPGVPSLDEDTALNTLPIVAETTCDATSIKNLIKFKTNHTTAYNWADPAADIDFGDFTFYKCTTTIADATQLSIFDNTSDTWLSKFTSLEQNQYLGESGYNATENTKFANNTDIGLIDNVTPASQSSVSRNLANQIAASVFGSNISYDIFDNEKTIFESCTDALESMASTIAAGFILDDTRATYIGERLIGRILAGATGETTSGGDATRFSSIGDTNTGITDHASAKFIPLEKDDEIFVKCSSVTVGFTDPLTGNAGTDAVVENFLIKLTLT